MPKTLKSLFPQGEYLPVWEAEQWFIHHSGPLQEHGCLKLRWGIKKGQEATLREELRTFFKKGPLCENTVEECREIIDRFLDREMAASEEEDHAGHLSEASNGEKLCFISSLPAVTPTILGRYGVSGLFQEAVRCGAIIPGIGGFFRGNPMKHRLIENNLKPGQWVYRVKDGKVQRVMVVSDDPSHVAVAGSEPGSPVDEENPEGLATEKPAP